MFYLAVLFYVYCSIYNLDVYWMHRVHLSLIDDIMFALCLLKHEPSFCLFQVSVQVEKDMMMGGQSSYMMPFRSQIYHSTFLSQTVSLPVLLPLRITSDIL
jgi:hypothetical protein